MKKIIGLCVLILMSGGIAYNAVALQGLSIDKSPDKRLDEKIKSFVVENKIPGLAIAIVKNNELYFANAYGVKNIDTKEPVTTESIFHMASVSKPFTATAIMQLVEKGMINLDDPLVKYLPYFKLKDPRYKDITIKQMLTHTSGIPDVEDYEWSKPQYDDGAAERYVRSLANEKLLYAPGKKFSYSNMAFDILGDVIAKVSGMTFEDYIKTNILNPLEMTESDFLIERIKPGLRTTPHVSRVNRKVSPVYPYNRRHAPSSCLNANVLEMSHWAMANMNRWTYKGKRILSESSYELLFENQIKQVTTERAVGLSWSLKPYRELKTIYHAGGDLGYCSYLIMIPEKSIAIIVAGNYFTESIGQLPYGIIDILLEFER